MSETTWRESSESFGETIAGYYEALGHDRSESSVQSTITTNTEQVPGRAQNLLLLLEHLGGLQSLEGSRILEAGSGFGALATYLAWTQWPQRVLAIDNRQDLIELAEQAAAPFGIRELEFRVEDMRTLASCGDDEFDVVILNNALIYIPDTKDVDRTLASMARVLAPGGRVLFYHANRWTWRDPFSHDPIVHLLPSPLAKALSAATGWKHNHGRIGLLSPRQLRRRCAKVGLVEFRSAARISEAELRTGLRLGGATFYGAVARLSSAS